MFSNVDYLSHKGKQLLVCFDSDFSYVFPGNSYTPYELFEAYKELGKSSAYNVARYMVWCDYLARAPLFSFFKECSRQYDFADYSKDCIERQMKKIQYIKPHEYRGLNW